MHRMIALVFVAAVAASACGEDDPVGTFAIVITPTTAAVEPDIDVDLEAAADPTGPVEIPDKALDFTGQAEVEVVVQDNSFEQRIIVIDPGTQVTWMNEGIQPHNVQPAIEGAFEPIPTGELDPDASNARTFEAPGDYPYFCSLHGTATRGQTGRVIVVAA